MFRRIKNLWLWSTIRPTPAGFKWNGWVEPVNQSATIEMKQIYPTESAKIIPYNRRNPIQELLEDSE